MMTSTTASSSFPSDGTTAVPASGGGLSLAGVVASGVGIGATLCGGAFVLWRRLRSTEDDVTIINTRMDVRIAQYMPSYLPRHIIHSQKLERLIRLSWQRVLSARTEAYNTIYTELVARNEIYRAQPDMAWHTVFYGRLFELLPSVVPKFRAGNMQNQGSLFTRMFNFAVVEFGKPQSRSNFSDGLVKLAKFHNGMGVISYDYCCMGQTLFYSIRRFLGSEFTRDVEAAWLHFYGHMMMVIIPVVVEGTTLSKSELHAFHREMAQSYASPSMYDVDVNDLRTYAPVFTSELLDFAAMSTLGRAYEHGEARIEDALAKLPRTDMPTKITQMCPSCNVQSTIRVPFGVSSHMTAAAARQNNGPAMTVMPSATQVTPQSKLPSSTLPGGSNEHFRPTRQRTPRASLSLDTVRENAGLFGDGGGDGGGGGSGGGGGGGPVVSGGIQTPKASEAGTTAEAKGVLSVTVSCPACEHPIEVMVPTEQIA